MADAQLKLSRRSLLGAVCAAPVLGLSEGDFLRPERAARWRDVRVTFAVGATPTVRFERSREVVPSAAEALRPQWQKALARFRSAEATLTALEGDPDEDAFGRAHDRFNAALRRLLAFPAPDIAALAAKLEIAVAAELADLTYAPPSLAALAQDARRLASRSS
jgi:hypothetical protein